MKAVLLTDYGDVDKLVVREVPEVAPAPDEIKVKVLGTSVNPVDYKLRRGELRDWMPLELPAILGRDVAGEVIATGADVRTFAPGDWVMGLAEHSYAETVTAKADVFTKIPVGVDVSEAAALPLVGLTGAQLIEEAIAPQEGDVLLVTGAVGSVGRVAVFTAQQRGARVIAGVRGSQKLRAQALNADAIVALDDPDEVARLPDLDAVADTVDGAVVESLLSHIKPGGVLGSVIGEPSSAHNYPVTVHTILTHPDARRLNELGEAVARGQLSLQIDERYDLEHVREAHQSAEQHGKGKVVLLP